MSEPGVAAVGCSCAVGAASRGRGSQTVAARSARADAASQARLRVVMREDKAVGNWTARPRPRHGRLSQGASALRQHLDEVAHFLRHLGRVADRLGNLRAHDLAEALPQPVNRHLHRAFAEVQAAGQPGL